MTGNHDDGVYRAAVSDHLTDHGRAHFKTYVRVLDRVAGGADPAEIARVVLGADMDRHSERGIGSSRLIMPVLFG